MRSTISDSLSKGKGWLKFIEFGIIFDDNRIYVSYLLLLQFSSPIQYTYSNIYFAIWRCYIMKMDMKFIISSADFFLRQFSDYAMCLWIYVCVYKAYSKRPKASNKYILMRYIFLLFFALLSCLFHVPWYFYCSTFLEIR